MAEWLEQFVSHAESCGMAGSIPIVARTRDPPYCRGFRELETYQYKLCGRVDARVYKQTGHGQRLADPPKNADN